MYDAIQVSSFISIMSDMIQTAVKFRSQSDNLTTNKSSKFHGPLVTEDRVL